MVREENRRAPSISENRMRELLLFQNNAGLSFSNITLLDNAFVHSSYANEVKIFSIEDNERLEFLGDSVLSVSVSEYLYNNCRGNEGDFTKIRSFVVSEESLANIAANLEIDKYLIMGKGEELTGGRHKKAILADCMEAVFAAVFLDKGFEEAKKFILKLLIPTIKDVINKKQGRDYKTALQEYVQKRYKKVPTYSLIRSEGPEHEQVFWYSVEVNGKKFGPVSGKNKKEAEQNVAKLAYETLQS